MNFLGYRVLFGVYKSWLYTQQEKEEEDEEEGELWGSWLDTNKLFWGSPCYWDKKACRPKKNTTPRDA